MKITVKSHNLYLYREIYEFTLDCNGCIYNTHRLNKFIHCNDEHKLTQNKNYIAVSVSTDLIEKPEVTLDLLLE